MTFLHISVQEFSTDVLHLCTTILQQNDKLHFVYLDIESFDNITTYDMLLQYIFDDTKRKVKHLTVDIEITDIENRLLQHLQNSGSLETIFFNNNDGNGFRLGPTSHTVQVDNIQTLHIVGCKNLITDSILTTEIFLPSLRAASFYEVTLNENTESFLLRHKSTILDLDIRCDITNINLPKIVQACENLTDLSINHGTHTLLELAHPNVKIIQLDNVGFKYRHQLPYILLNNVAFHINEVIQQQEQTFPSLHTIQILDFHRGSFTHRSITFEIYQTWCTLFAKAECKNVKIFDIEMEFLHHDLISNH